MTPRLNSLLSKRRLQGSAARFGKLIRSKLKKKINLVATARRSLKLSLSRNKPKRVLRQKRGRVTARMTPLTTSSPRCSAHPTRKVKSRILTAKKSNSRRRARRRVHHQPKKVAKRKSPAPAMRHPSYQSREVRLRCRLRRMLTAQD